MRLSVSSPGYCTGTTGRASRLWSDPTGTYSFTFDNMGRLIGTTTNYAFLTGRHLTTGYGYDNLSNLLSVVHKKGTTTLDGASYTVDNAGNRQSRTALPGTTYDPMGNRQSNLAGSSR